MLHNPTLPHREYFNGRRQNILGSLVLGSFVSVFIVAFGVSFLNKTPKTEAPSTNVVKPNPMATQSSQSQVTELPTSNRHLLSDIPKELQNDLPMLDKAQNLSQVQFDEKYQLWWITFELPCNTARSLTDDLKTQFNAKNWQTSNVQDFPSYDSQGNKQPTGDAFDFGFRRLKGANESSVNVGYIKQREVCVVSYSVPVSWFGLD